MNENLLYLYGAGEGKLFLNRDKSAHMTAEDGVIMLDTAPFLASLEIGEEKNAGLHDVRVVGHALANEFIWKATDAAVLPFFFKEGYSMGIYDGLVELTVSRGVPTLTPVDCPLIEIAMEG